MPEIKIEAVYDDTIASDNEPQSKEEKDKSGEDEIQPEDLLRFSWQIASGMVTIQFCQYPYITIAVTHC